MSVQELCEDICDVKTIRRLEKGSCNVHLAIRLELFEKLRLPLEYQRKDIVTDNYEILVLHRDMTKAVNNFEMERFAELLIRLKGLLNLKERANRQEIERMEILCQYHMGKISKQECVERLKAVLECNVPMKNLESAQKGYLTCGELECLYNMAIRAEGEEKAQCIELLRNLCGQFDEENMVKEHMAIYEYSIPGMPGISGGVGGMGGRNGILWRERTYL